MKHFICGLLLILVHCSAVQYKSIYTKHSPVPDEATKQVIHIHVDKMFSQQDRLSIDNAINQWNYALNNQILLRVINYDFDMEPEILTNLEQKGDWVFLKVDSSNPAIPDKLTLAWADKIGGNIVRVVRNKINANDIEPIFLHEIGHLLHLNHDPSVNSLMYDKYNKYSYLCVDQASVQKVALIYKLDKNAINYCIVKY